MRFLRALFLFLAGFAALSQACARASAQAALLLEDSNGLSAVMAPAGHNAVYFARICAASPIKLRRCEPGELGVVIARHRRIAGYDWLAIPLVPFLYSVDNDASVPTRVSGEAVQEMRQNYHDTHLMSLGPDVPAGGAFLGGWKELAGAAYERRMYAFKFETSEKQDDAFIAKMNATPNRSHFNYLFSNCADLSGAILDFYFPDTFRRRILPDFGIVSPRQVAYELARYARKHPEIQLTVMEIPMIPGYRHAGRMAKSLVASLIVGGYVVPVAILSPYAAGAIVADCLVWGRYPLELKHPEVLSPQTLAVLAGPTGPSLAQKTQGTDFLEASAATSTAGSTRR